MAAQLSVPQLGQVPLTVEVMKSGESGIPAVLGDGNKALIESYSNIVKNLESQLALWED